MQDVIIIVVVLAILSGAALYVYKAKKSGKTCIGCPAGGCSSKNGCSGCSCGCGKQ